MKLKLEKTVYFWTYVLFGLLCAVLGAALLPSWAGEDLFFSGWGKYSVNITVSGLILGYIFFYLVKRIRRYSNTPAQIVAVVELVVMAVIAVVCSVSLFVGDISFGEPCRIVAITVWVRGVSGVFTGYYCDSNIVRAAEEERREKKKKVAVETKKEQKETTKIDTEALPVGRVDDFTVWRLAFAVVLISVGTFLFVEPVIKPIHLQWLFSCSTLAIGLFFMVFGMAKKPTKVKVEKESPVNKETEQKPKSGEVKVSEPKAQAEVTDSPQLETPKVNIKLSEESANAMTQTAAYDAIDKETEKEQ